jgi:hypothetical protein
MTAMAEHDCITTHQPTTLGTWQCPDCEHEWLWVVGGINNFSNGFWWLLPSDSVTTTGTL